MKKVLAFSLALCLVFALFLTAAAKEERFDVATDSELPYLYEKHPSIGTSESSNQRNNALDVKSLPIYFCDNDRYLIYKFDFDANDVSALISIVLANEYLLSASKDGKTWTEVGREPTNEHSQNNIERRNFELSSFLKDNSDKTVYIKLSDHKTDDGWGGYTTGEIAFYSSDKEFTLKETNSGLTSKAPVDLTELVTFKDAAATPADTTPTTPAATEKPTTPATSTDTGSSGKGDLPATSDNALLGLAFAGMALACAGTVIIIKKRK